MHGLFPLLSNSFCFLNTQLKIGSFVFAPLLYIPLNKNFLSKKKNLAVSLFITFCLAHIKKMEIEKLKDNLTHLRAIIEELEEIIIIEKLEIENIK